MAVLILKITGRTDIQGLSTNSVRPVPKSTTSQRNAILEPVHQTDRLPAMKTDGTEPESTIRHTEHCNFKCPVGGPNIELEKPCFYSRTAPDRPETTTTKKSANSRGYLAPTFRAT